MEILSPQSFIFHDFSCSVHCIYYTEQYSIYADLHRHTYGSSTLICLEDRQLIFWPGSLGARGFSAIIEAAVAGGYTNVAVSPLTISQLYEEGFDARDIIDEARRNNLVLKQLDGVSSWAPIRHQAHAAPALKQRFDFASDQCLDMAVALGLDSVLALGAFDRGALPMDVLVRDFGRFCDAAAAVDLRVELEFVPYWGIPDLPAAWEILRGTNRPNAGILVDTWHLQKGSSDFERDLQLLAQIPTRLITSIQVADAMLATEADSIQSEGRLRRFPGDGELAIERIVKIADRDGTLRLVGTEIFGRAIDGLSNREAGNRCAIATKAVITRAGLPGFHR
jgi:sugar phosphate isomerase/epimerase